MSAQKNWYDKSNEKAKPSIKPDVLRARRAKASAIKAAREQQAADLKQKYKVSAQGEMCHASEGFLKWTSKVIDWRENFRAYREKQKSFSQWVPKQEFFPMVVYGGPESTTSCSTFDLSNFQELNIPEDESYRFFERCWMAYDKNGSGKIGYQEFESMLKDIGFQFGRPSRQEVDPARTGKISWSRAVTWWTRSVDPAERSLARISAAKLEAARRVKKAKRSREPVEIFSTAQRSRARKNAQTKLSASRKKFREFRKKNKGRLNPRLILDVTFRSQTGKGAKQYDITDYKPFEIDAPAQQQRTVDFIWKQYDKNGIGSMTYETFQKMFKEQNLSGQTTFAQKGKQVQFADFIQWWFAGSNTTNDQDEKEVETPSKQRKGRKVSKKVKEFQEKMALERSKFRRFRKKGACTPQKNPKDRVEIRTARAPKKLAQVFEYSLTDYMPAFIPAGKELQLDQLDLIWKQYDTEGSGKMDVPQFQRMLKKQGLNVTSEKALAKLQDADKRVSFEKFSTWWFTKSTDIIPQAPPAPEEKKQKAQTIRSSLASIHDAHQGKYQLASDEAWAKSRFEAQKTYREKSEDFKKWRLSKSPAKARSPDFEVEVRYNDPGLVVQGRALF